MVGMYPSAVARQAEIESAIHEVERKLTPEVVRIRYEIGEDWSGQWAIFFRVVLTDDAARHRLRDIATKVVWGLAQQLDFSSMGDVQSPEVARCAGIQSASVGPSPRRLRSGMEHRRNRCRGRYYPCRAYVH